MKRAQKTLKNKVEPEPEWRIEGTLEIICPWCKDPKSDEVSLATDGVLYCCRCCHHFVWHRHVEYTYTTLRMKYCAEE